MKIRTQLLDSLMIAYGELQSFDTSNSWYGLVSSGICYGPHLEVTPSGDILVHPLTKWNISEPLFTINNYGISILDNTNRSFIGYDITEEEFFQLGVVEDLYDLMFEDVQYCKHVVHSVMHPIMVDKIAEGQANLQRR